MATAKQQFLPGDKKPVAVKYIAACNHSDNYYEGSLQEILEAMEDNESDPDDYRFVRDEPVKVKFVKKLVLEEDDGNS